VRVKSFAVSEFEEPAMATKDVISPLAFSCAQCFGYAVFAIAWIVIAFAALELARQILSLRPAMRVIRPRRVQVLMFPPPAPRRVSRGY
jgi:hypothetical protein